MKNRKIKKRIIEISHKNGLSHLGSCLTAVDIINNIYKQKIGNDIFILSSGHAALAWYCVLEHYEGHDAEQLFAKHGVHPNRDTDHGICVSSGSLGHGVGIGVGYAIANRYRHVHILLSDGETSEGSVYESLNVARDLELHNLHIHVNANGYGAYRKIVPYKLTDFFGMYKALEIQIHHTENDADFPFLCGLDAHYKVMSEDEYRLAMEILK